MLISKYYSIKEKKQKRGRAKAVYVRARERALKKYILGSFVPAHYYQTALLVWWFMNHHCNDRDGNAIEVKGGKGLLTTFFPACDVVHYRSPKFSASE